MSYFVEVLVIVLLSTVKFLYIPPLALLHYKMHVYESLFYHSFGGILGVYVFYFLGTEILVGWKWVLDRDIVQRLTSRFFSTSTRLSTKRKIVRIKSKWGLWGIVIFTPCLLSIPLGTFLVVRFFPGTRSIMYLCLSIIVWSCTVNFGFAYVAGML